MFLANPLELAPDSTVANCSLLFQANTFSAKQRSGTAFGRSARPSRKRLWVPRLSRRVLQPRSICDLNSPRAQRAQAFVAPNEESGEKVKVKPEKHEGGMSSAALEMVKKIKASQPPQAAVGAVGGLLSSDASKYFAFGQSQSDTADNKHKKSKREEGSIDNGEQKKKKKKTKE